MIYKFKNGAKILSAPTWENKRLTHNLIQKSGLGSKFLSSVGIDEEEHPYWHLGLDLASYLNPWTGLASSVIDARDALQEGRYGDAALEAAFAIPFVGGTAKAINKSRKLLAATKKGSLAARKTRKAARKVVKVTKSKPAKYASTAAWGYTLGDIGQTVWNNRDYLWGKAKDYVRGLFD